MSSSVCFRPVIIAKSIDGRGFSSTRIILIGSEFAANRVSFTDSRLLSSRICGARASMVDSYGSSDFVKRMEQAWEISQQPTPICCSSCHSNGHVECQWCKGTGFFILGDNMLCQVPSRNTSCVICAGKGSIRCFDCKGTGYRAKWLGEPPVSK
ncbi:hypothetical protein SDJN02_13217 [Cucurbita argyrosperma subsp. argyrosperma]|nr:hypothetical protein SDJN02_13217 [Cucurbita argyrosperma subsp. argyrosperma]